MIVNWMKLSCTLLLCQLFFCAGAYSQGVRRDDVASSNVGSYMVVAPFASVRVCQNGATGLPCSPLALIYSNSALTSALPNPFPADASGNYFFYAHPGTYMIQVTTVGGTYSQPDQTLPNLPGSVTTTFNYISVPFSSTPVFAFVANSMFKMVLTGSVTGSTLTGGPVAGATAMFSICEDAVGGYGFSFPSGFVLPSGFALNTTANACNNLLFTYDGTSWQGIGGGGGGGGGSFGSLTGGVNTTAVMTLGSGGILTFTTGGIVNASRIVGIDFTGASGCSSITYLRGDGQCQTPIGAGNVSTTTGSIYGIPTWTGPTTLGNIASTVAGQPLLGEGASAYPAYGALNLAGGSNFVTGLLPIANLASDTITLNGQTQTLGAANINIPFQVNTNGGNTSQAGTNLINSTANASGLTWSVTNPSTNVEKGEVGGNLNLANLYWPTPTNPNDSVCPNGSSGAVDCVTGIVLGNSGADVTTTYTVGCDGTAKPDRGKEIETSGTFTLTVPAVGTSGCQAGFPFFISDISGILTVTSASNFTISTGAGAPTVATTFSMAPGQLAAVRNVDNGSWRVYETIGSIATGSGQATLATASIPSGSCATAVSVAATGVTTTSPINTTFAADPTSTTGYIPSASGMLSILSYPTAGYVNFKVCNNTGSAIVPGAVVTLNWNVGTSHLIASGTQALGTGLIASGACAAVAQTAATGVATTDAITTSFNGDPTGVVGYQPLATGMLSVLPFPTSGYVNFRVCNNTAAGITPGAITLNYVVTR